MKNILTFTILLYGFACLLVAEPTVILEKKKSILLTGAAGFIGSNFLQYMFDKYSNYEFLVLDNLTYAGSLENIPDYIKMSPRFKFFYGSVTNQNLVNKLMRHAHFVVHFAAESHVTRSIGDDEIFFSTDVMGTRCMMRALVENRRTVERFIHISTSEVCGTAQVKPMTELHPINPRSPYAAAKAGAERLVYAYCCTYDVPATIVRPFNNFGPKQHPEKLIPRLITRAISGKTLIIDGDGLQERDWVHTQDIARALDKILHIPDFTPIKHQVIHLGSGRAVSVLTIAKLIQKYFHLPDDRIAFGSDRPGQVRCHLSSTEKAYNLLGWKAEISLDEGIASVIDWYLKNKGWWLRGEIMQNIPANMYEDLDAVASYLQSS